MAYICLEASFLTSILHLPASPTLFYLLSFTVSSHLCHLITYLLYKLLQHLRNRENANKPTAEKRQKKQSIVYGAPTMRQALCPTLAVYSLIGFSQEAPPSSNPALPHSSWLTLGKAVTSTLNCCFLHCEMERYWLILV